MSYQKTIAGLYWGGVIVVENSNCLLYTIAHELAHAHQHAIAVREIELIATPHDWENTSEGKAYALKAWKKDWEEVGKFLYETGRYLTPVENMAIIAGTYWNIEGKFDTQLCFITTNLEKEAPNRFRWAQEWLSKKYD